MDCRASDAAAQPRALLRRQLRRARATLTAEQRAGAERRIHRFIAHTGWLHAGQAIGLYVAVGHEVASAALQRLALSRGCRVYLPRILDYRAHRMQFVRARGAHLQRNRYGIPEPQTHAAISVRALSVVFLPLLGVDEHGTRLGSGAGYYDRLFAYRRYPAHRQRPLLVGIAYECQRLSHIDRDRYDVPLDALVSERGIVRFAPAMQ